MSAAPQPTAGLVAGLAAAPVPVKETAGEKVKTIFTDIGKFIQGAENTVINVAEANKPALMKYLPPAISGPLLTAVDSAATTFAALEMQEQAIGGTSMPFAEKTALIVALQGAAIAKLLAQAGLNAATADVNTVVQVACGIGNLSLNLSGVTKAPVPVVTA